MENPLSEAQIKKIQEIAKLPQDKQQQELQKFIKILNPEQLEFLQQQQGTGSCPFCSIAQGKIPARVIYEDHELIAILDINPASKGHTLVIPKEHFGVSAQVPDKLAGKMFVLANKIAALLFEALKADGTNILLSNGAIAGQNVTHVMVHVIPRFKDDKLSFLWKGQKADEKELEKLHNHLKGKVKLSNEPEVIKQDAPTEIDDDEFDEDLLP